jgi:hypothetical protein
MDYGDAIYCEYCEMWLNGPTQFSDHLIGKKHRKHRKAGGRKQRPTRDKGIEAPPGTVFLVEQIALYKDAVSQYTLGLYSRALLRSRM